MARNATPSTRHLSPRDLESLRQSLLAERSKVFDLYRHDLTAAQQIQEEGVEDLEELATMDIDRELLFSWTEAEREKVTLIDEALQRMDDGTYGLCQSTGEPIPLARLREVPWARYRLEVQEEVEQGLPAGRP